MRSTTRMASRIGRSSRRRRSIVTWCAPGIAVFATVVAAQVFEISRSTIDGGGAVQSQGGGFDLSGTMGQPDAGVMSGGSFELTGGFWFAVPPADCNDDGLVNLLDTKDFASCMSGPATAPSLGCRCFNIDGNGGVDLADFKSVQTGFIGD